MRKVIDETTYQSFFIEYYGSWVKVPTRIVKDSFPSTNTIGYPERILMHPTSAGRVVENIGYRHVYNNGRLSGIVTVPDQYLGYPTEAHKQYIRQSSINKAIAMFMDKKQQLAADFGERQKSIDMIASRLLRAYKILKNLKKFQLVDAYWNFVGRHPKGSKKRSRRAAKAWLEYKYGWEPLVTSIADIANKEFPPKPSIYISETVKRPFDVNINKNGRNYTSYGYVQANCSFLAEMDMPLTATAEKLGLINPVSVAWELVPFSFVVDWFIPIGTWLENLSYLNGYVIVDKSVTTKVRYYGTVSGGEAYRNKMERSLLRETSFSLSFRPYFKNPFTKVHALNALALIRTLRKN